MKKGYDFIKSVLSELDKQFSHEKCKANITSGENESLRFSFFCKDRWYAFELIESDFAKLPEELIEEVRKDLKI
jgi:hypothetical protein